MATIDLGKIKLKWRGTYAGGTAYVPDDVVEYTDGSVTSSYICVTASSFKTGTSNVHSTGYECTNINATGVVTAAQFKGDGSNLSGLASREVYGFTGIGNSLSLTTTNNGADNITNATYVAFEENFIGPSGISFSINTSGNLIMTV